MRRKKKSITLFLAIGLALSLTACGNGTEGGLISNLSGANLTDRYNAYVDLSNIMFGNVNSKVNDYFTYVAAEEEFSLVDDGYLSYGLSKYDYEDLETAYGFAQKESEYADVDTAVAALYPTMKRVMELLDEAAAYGEQKNYLDDDYAKAKEIHTELYPLLDTYVGQMDAFTASFSVLVEIEDEKELQQMKDEGYEIRYTMLKLLDVLDDISAEFNNQDTVHSENINELDLTNITPLYDEFSNQVANYRTYIKDDAALESEGFDSTFRMWLDNFADAAVEMKVCLTDMIQRVKNNEPPSETAMMFPERADGTFEAFSRINSDLVNDYNSAIE